MHSKLTIHTKRPPLEYALIEKNMFIDFRERRRGGGKRGRERERQRRTKTQTDLQ